MKKTKLVIAMCAILAMGTVFLIFNYGRELSKKNIIDRAVYNSQELPHWWKTDDPEIRSTRVASDLAPLLEAWGPDSLANYVYQISTAKLLYGQQLQHKKVIFDSYKKLDGMLSKKTHEKLREISLKKGANPYLLQLYLSGDSLINALLSGSVSEEYLKCFLFTCDDSLLLARIAPKLSDQIVRESEMGRYIPDARLRKIAENCENALSGYLMVANLRDRSKRYLDEAKKMSLRRVSEFSSEDSTCMVACEYMTQDEAAHFFKNRKVAKK